MSEGRLSWYFRRLSRMSPEEVGWRVRDKVVQQALRRQQVSRLDRATDGRFEPRRFSARLPEATEVPRDACDELVRAAEDVLDGRLEILGVERTDLVAPDWFKDPVTGMRAPAHTYAFDINYRSEAEVGNIKQIWELSRLHHVTLLAAAFCVSGREEFATRAAGHIESWCEANPFLEGINWTSGIEVGIRLISFAWARRLLEAWEPSSSTFEANELFVDQIRCHQRFLATFQSRGSSANNHVIAEAAGQLVGSCAFPWFDESAAWREGSRRLLVVELDKNTFSSGLNREQATEYHRFVAELGLLAALEAELAGCTLPERTWRLLTAMMDAAAAIIDCSGRAPRQGDGDDGRALVVDAPSVSPWNALLDAGAKTVGALDWWPTASPTVCGALLGSLPSRASEPGSRPPRRPSHFEDAGLSLLRTRAGERPEIWCRCDAGPHGFLSIAAHAHADALAVEVRHDGVDILADPGTYCYHGEPRWRQYFRATRGHNTIELDGTDQAVSGGPFLWLTRPQTAGLEIESAGDGRVEAWRARHGGYHRLRPPAAHTRVVRLDEASSTVTVEDEVAPAGGHLLTMAWHLGPTIEVELDGTTVRLSWTFEGRARTARLRLPDALEWTAHRGEEDPVLGWYSPSFGARQPSFSLLGTGPTPEAALLTTLEFSPEGR